VWIDRVFHQAVMRAGIVDFRFHDIRHTAASYLAMSGASLRDIAEILGHRNIQQTMIYAHLVESHTRGVVERMVHRFLRPPEPPAL
jgi:integrase